MAILTDRLNTLNLPITPTKFKQANHDLNESDKSSDKRRSESLLTPESTPKKLKPNGVFSNSVYSQAKALFQRGSKHVGPYLLGRESEGTTINTFLQDKIRDNTNGSMYIAGPPGTGKSELINTSFRRLEEMYNKDNLVVLNKNQCKLVKLNCMVVTNPLHIFHEIYCSIIGQLSISFYKKKTADDMRTLLNENTEVNSIVVVLDEMDCLITKNQEILFELFSLANEVTKVKFILVGISNSLDFTNKFMPRLKMNGINTQLVQFLPYTFEQTKYIVTTKLRSLQDKENITSEVPLFHPSALQLCCKKAASITGDLRTAFDLVYKSIEVVENSLRLSGKDIQEYTVADCPKVLLPHVARVCLQSFSNTNALNNTGKTINNLNLLQKTTLCYLYKYQMIKPFGCTVNSFYDYYLIHNNLDKLVGTVKKGEFIEILSALESSSLVLLADTKRLNTNDLGSKLIRMNIRKDDLFKSIGEIGVLKRILRA